MKKRWVKIMYNLTKNDQKVLFWYEKFGYNFYYYYLKFRHFLTGKNTLLHFVYLTNTQCTLKCKECHTWIPYFPKNNSYMCDFETFKSEIDKLLKSVDLINSFRFQGGETLLTKDLAKMVEYACSKKQIQHIQIITNGTIVPSMELIKAMRNPKVLLSMSDYSGNEDIKNRLKYNEISKLCKENNVNVKFWLIKAGDLWIGKNTINSEQKIDKKLSIKNNDVCYCFNNPQVVMFFKGKIYLCPPVIYFSTINPDFFAPEDEIIDIINTSQNILTKKINTFISKKYYNLCSRCDAFDNKDIRWKPGVQLPESL